MSGTPRVLLFSRDPGGTNPMIALHEVLTGALPAPAADLARLIAPFAAAAPLVLAKDYAVPAWRRAGIVPAVWPGAAALDGWLQGAGIGLVLTATSDVDDDSPQRLWQAARRAGLPSACFLDLAVNLPGRFRLRGCGTVVHPDLVFAWDDAMAAALAEAGVPTARLRRCGNPHPARLRRLAADVPAEAIAALRAAWGALPGERVVLFASDCGREITAAGRPIAYDEIAGLDRLLALAAGARVVIRPHPKDAPGKYARYAGRPAVVVSAAGARVTASLAADLVAGMDSALLAEAEAIGRPVASLWPEHPRYDDRLLRNSHQVASSNPVVRLHRNPSATGTSSG